MSTKTAAENTTIVTSNSAAEQAAAEQAAAEQAAAEQAAAEQAAAEQAAAEQAAQRAIELQALIGTTIKQKALANARNAHQIYGELFSDNRHVHLTGLTITADNETEIYGVLKFAVMHVVVNEKGFTTRGHIEPIKVKYNVTTGKISIVGDTTDKARERLAIAVKYGVSLMKKYVSGKTAIASNDLKKIMETRGFNNVKYGETFKTFMSLYAPKGVKADETYIEQTTEKALDF